MEKEENWLKCSPFKLRHGKKVLLIFVAINVVIIWLYYYKSSSVSYFYYQSRPAIPITVPLPIYNVSVYHIPLLQAKDMAPFYIEVNKKTWCFLYGIDLIDSKKQKKCMCLDNWFGLDCGIPACVWKSDFLQEGKNGNIEIRRREKPRRIIFSFVVDDYQDILDINLYNSFSVVDLYLTIEQWNQKPSVLNRFESGQFSEFQSKIIPFQSSNISDIVNSEKTASLLKNLWDIGWKRLSDFRPDDLFIFSQASSIVSKDILLFLKLYDGYPEPFFFELRPLLFKFSMKIKSNNTDAKLVPFRPTGCTFQYLSSMCDFDISKMLSNDCKSQDKKSFEKNNWKLKSWIIGNDKAPSGWQCNACCKNKSLKTHQDELRFLKIPVLEQNTNSSSVNQLLDKLLAYNGGELTFEEVLKSDPFFAPNVVLNNEKQYSYLMESTENKG